MLLAYRPFIDPINLHDWWFLLLGPMALGISIAYKAVRMLDLKDYVRQVVLMTVQIILGMIGLGIASYLFVQHVLPLVAP
jgi:hypothetical protein